MCFKVHIEYGTATGNECSLWTSVWCRHLVPFWSCRRMFLNGWMKRKGKCSVPGLNKHMVLSIVLAWLILCCFLWPLHPLWTWKIISWEKVTMWLKVCLFVMMLQILLGLRWDGLAVYTTIRYGQTVIFTYQRKSISATKCTSWWFGIFHIISYGSCFQKGPQFQPERREEILQHNAG